MFYKFHYCAVPGYGTPISRASITGRPALHFMLILLQGQDKMSKLKREVKNNKVKRVLVHLSCQRPYGKPVQVLLTFNSLAQNMNVGYRRAIIAHLIHG